MAKMNQLSMDVAEEKNKDIDSEYGVCIGCGGRATKTNNTLCQACWNDAEGNE